MASNTFPHFPRFQYEDVPMHKLALTVLKWGWDRVQLRHEQKHLSHK